MAKTFCFQLRSLWRSEHEARLAVATNACGRFSHTGEKRYNIDLDREQEGVGTKKERIEVEDIRELSR